ncbi:pyridoxamine 5'-phosphate oxidase family protein [Micromonospora sp. NPDC005710]|uniref:pyridoxamine 5'-phosphate oxidase family protein n=1 Tax=Micromonospora sp. NPDC005710 TaxID=3157051 RepID=UPI0033FD1D36
MEPDPPRDPTQRKHDTLARFDRDLDAWVASADRDGNPYLVPLSFLWDGTAFILATAESSPTARNLQSFRRVRMSLGTTRDVVLIDGTAETFSRETVPPDLADAFAAKLWDARVGATRYAYFRVTPCRIQAWREENEIAGRDLMRDGRWLV